MGIEQIRNLKQAHEDKKPRTRYINPKSEKRVIEEKEYLKVRAEVLKENPVCVFPGCNEKSVDAHHSEGRVGKNYTDKKKLKAMCRKHHTFCELNPKIARTLKLSNSRLKKA